MKSVRRIATTTGAGIYVYDYFFGGKKINRSSRAVIAGAYTVFQYKLMWTYSNKSINEIHRSVAESWLWAVRKNGGLYSKLAQGIASMNHVLPPEIVETLSVIQDHAPFAEWPLVQQIIFEEYGVKNVNDVFLDIEHVPIASASIAQGLKSKKQ